jgi:hypothetical protein
LWVLARVCLRCGDTESAKQALERVLELGVAEPEDARAHLALARLHEHRGKAPDRAYFHARFTLGAEDTEMHGRRLGRLHRRLLRLSEP